MLRVNEDGAQGEITKNKNKIKLHPSVVGSR